MHKLVSAVMQREAEANVVVVDWLPMAQQLYPDAVNHTHAVGLDIAAMLNWLQVCAPSIAPRPTPAALATARLRPEIFRSARLTENRQSCLHM